jgi:hypothetical protein
LLDELENALPLGGAREGDQHGHKHQHDEDLHA